MANEKIPMQLLGMAVALDRLRTPSELFTHVCFYYHCAGRIGKMLGGCW